MIVIVSLYSSSKHCLITTANKAKIESIVILKICTGAHQLIYIFSISYKADANTEPRLLGGDTSGE